MDLEEHLSKFSRVEPGPALRERVFAAAAIEARKTWVERLWTRRTWVGLAAGLLVACAVFWTTARPSAAFKKVSAEMQRTTAPRRAPAVDWRDYLPPELRPIVKQGAK